MLCELIPSNIRKYRILFSAIFRQTKQNKYGVSSFKTYYSIHTIFMPSER